MPLFNFECKECHKIVQEFYWSTEEKIPPTCDCGGETERSYMIGNHVSTGDKERLSISLGVHPSQIESGEVFKMHPGAKFDRDGNMILKNRAEQKQRLRERGWVNRDSYC
jgi:NAD-dependent SIR2 family protein deacetylase